MKKLAKSTNKSVSEHLSSDMAISAKNHSFSGLPIIDDSAEVIQHFELQDIKELLKKIAVEPRIWLHVFHNNNHISTPDITSVCIGCENKVHLICWSNDTSDEFGKFITAYKGQIYGHDLKSDYYAIIRNCHISAEEGMPCIFNTAYDTSVAAYLIDSQKKSYELSILMLDYFHVEFPSDKEISEEVATIDMFGDVYETQGRLSKKIFIASSKVIDSH